MNLDFSAITPSIPYILKGLEVTLKIVAVSALAGFLLGTLLALCKIARIRALNIAADLYTSIFRGTPLVLQLMIIYFGVPQIIGYEIPAFLAAVLAFSLNSGAYMSEVIRAGIQAVDKGQTEAAMALGIPYGKNDAKYHFSSSFKKYITGTCKRVCDTYERIGCSNSNRRNGFNAPCLHRRRGDI